MKANTILALLAAAVALLTAACNPSAGTSAPPANVASRAQALATGDSVPGEYIVVYRDDIDTASVASSAPKRVRHSFERVLKGFSAELDGDALEKLLANPDVAYVVPNTVARAGAAIAVEAPASWGLDRIDQRALPLDSAYSPSLVGSGVDIYVVDTGVRITHQDFGGRAAYATSPNNGDFVGDQQDADDCHGHGTHVAGTSAGSTFGVASDANIIALRVLNCSGSGTYDGIIAALDWVAENADGPSVVNMSLGGGQNQALDDAVASLTAAGVVVAVAAGNSNGDACGRSPAAAPSAITVGATTSGDGEASYSNVGTCVDILAPGTDITSAWYTSDAASNTISGTSMASPHVAGAAALYLGQNPSATPAAVTTGVLDSATWNAISMKSNSTSTPNALLYVEFDDSGWKPSCETATNRTHKKQKRARRLKVDGVRSFYARGSGDYMGQAGKTISHLEETSEGVWNVVPWCEAPPPPPPPADDSCETRCDSQAPAGCWCDTLCEGYGDCCDDYSLVCPSPPVYAACETGLNRNHRLEARAYRTRNEAGKMRFYAVGDGELIGRGKDETSLVDDPELGWVQVEDCAAVPPTQ